MSAMRPFPAVPLLAALLAPALARAAAPVYVHMNGGNYFLEPVVAVRPGQPVVFVNQDTGAHTIAGYNPLTGALSRRFEATLAGTKGPGHKLATYTVSFAKAGFKPYLCTVHARLASTFGGAVQPVKRAGTHGFKGPMAGLIVVTTDPALLADNPPTAAEKIVPGFFGG
jgi:plastocyanin